MVRPTKWRKIENIPDIQYFVPSNEERTERPEKVLKIEELEAIRLKDLEGLEQEECALRMEVSRATFQRILVLARKKVADCLCNGKIIHIEGGNFTRNICLVKCLDCDNEWTESYENLDTMNKGGYNCPDCGSVRIICGQNDMGDFCLKNCRRHARND